MPSFSRQFSAEVAFAKVAISGGVLTVLKNRGYASITRSGAGVVVLVREAGATGAALAASDVQNHVTPQAAASAKILSADDTNETTTTVTSFGTNGSPADCSFTISCRQATNFEPVA